MHLGKLSLPVLVVALAACANEPQLLNSERIEQRFGSFGIDVLLSEPGLRLSNLYSLEDGIPVCRTYAIVRFVDELDGAISAEHEQVLAGHSIGATFKANGWEVHKQTQFIGQISLQHADPSIAEAMRVAPTRDVAVHVYQFLLTKGGQWVDYATIIELHHPDYLTREALRRLFPVATDAELTIEQVQDLISQSLDAAYVRGWA